MIDPVVASLVQDVLGGRLSCVLPLLDRLYDTDDDRWRDVLRRLVKLQNGAARERARTEEHPDPANWWWGWEGCRLSLWKEFCAALDVLFALERRGAPTLEEVRELERLLDPTNPPTPPAEEEEAWPDVDPADGPVGYAESFGVTPPFWPAEAAVPLAAQDVGAILGQPAEEP